MAKPTHMAAGGNSGIPPIHSFIFRRSRLGFCHMVFSLPNPLPPHRVSVDAEHSIRLTGLLRHDR